MFLIDKFLEIFLQNPIGQSIGFFALFLGIFSFLTSNDKKFLIFTAISSFFWGIHFYYLGLFSASYINFFDIFKNILALKYKKNKYIFGVFLIIYLIIGYFTFEYTNYLSLIPIITSIMSLTFVYFLSGIRLKLGFLVILCLWFLYNFFGKSLGGMTSDVILIISSVIGIFRLKKDSNFRVF